MKKLRVGVLGTGAFAEACHVPGLQSHPDAEVVVLCGRNASRTRAMADRLGVPEMSLDYEQVCARKDLDAITIATPNVAHAIQAKAAFAGGKHVFCEKPLGMNVHEVVEMVRHAEQSHAIHQVAFTYRYLYGVQELKRRLLRGDIGEPYHVRVQYASWEGVKPDSKIGFREMRDAAGAGILYDVGSHLFDLIGFIIGPIEAVAGSTLLIPRERIDHRTGELAQVETDDIASAWFVCRDGIQGHLFASRATPNSGDKAYIEVVGREGALRASLSRGSVDILRVSRATHPAWELVPLPAEASDGTSHCLGTMMRSFVDACLRKKLNTDVDASFYDGLAVQRTMDAVQESACRPHWISLEADVRCNVAGE
ncbi:MAG: Putative Oxidoreductase [Nitrospira sp.]|nr:Gfo/Idh/MocA family oxidoreductase [Nitrospira sp.]ULA59349.1 MAG: Putative Oxidoreductase [Nitrospira sp.]